MENHRWMALISSFCKRCGGHKGLSHPSPDVDDSVFEVALFWLHLPSNSCSGYMEVEHHQGPPIEAMFLVIRFGYFHSLSWTNTVGRMRTHGVRMRMNGFARSRRTLQSIHRIPKNPVTHALMTLSWLRGWLHDDFRECICYRTSQVQVGPLVVSMCMQTVAARRWQVKRCEKLIAGGGRRDMP